ncbi:helix-turn-helix domain-containing protein [Maribacter sp. 2304DJ31-5]|uniref:helix-turn-helix domain-containing protein n=1 Tax=Maribacter sp. 2304DJ31-5 TaxID=3386273 RepID=UPI0039BC5022
MFNSKEVIAQEYLNTLQSFFSGDRILISYNALIFIIIILVISLIYFFKSVHEVRKYNRVLFANFSNLKNLKANWIVTFHRLWIILFTIPILVYFINYIYPILDMNVLASVLTVSLIALSFLFNSNILNQHYVLSDFQENDFKNNNPIVQKEAEDQFRQLENALEQQKYYQDENLSLHKLSSYLNIKPITLTELIKLSEYDNFYDLINTYRIKSIKKELIATNDQIIIIAYNNGFNSKSAFNRIFKEKTGKTPREYRKSKNTSLKD